MTDVILIGGPTASGKSQLALSLAKHFGSVILSADSRQVYSGLDIGTAKATLEERQAVPHYLLDICDPEETYTAGRFIREADALITELLPRHRPILVVGGTGLYLQALYAGLDEFPPISEIMRVELADFYRKYGIHGLQDRLKRVDPDYTREVDLNNPRRLQRAILVSEVAGRPYSSLRRGMVRETPYRMSGICLDAPPEWLAPRIQARVEAMVAAGLENEARRLYDYRSHPALQTVGYQEWFAYFEGSCTREEAINAMVIHTRQYAKRQRTWFRKATWMQVLSVEPHQSLLQRALTMINDLS